MNITADNLRSSQLHRLAWSGDEETGRMVIAFRNGGVYEYEGVPAETARAVIDAESAGKAFHALVKRGGYACTKLAELPKWAAEALAAEALKAEDGAA